MRWLPKAKSNFNSMVLSHSYPDSVLSSLIAQTVGQRIDGKWPLRASQGHQALLAFTTGEIHRQRFFLNHSQEFLGE